MERDDPIRLGWEEWLGLPALGLPALLAKVDTGARTSALHAADILLVGPSSAPRVRFTVHPDPADAALAVTCEADVVDRREVTSSNGESEMRYVISTALDLGDGAGWPIEITLTHRPAMTARMLLGRQAVAGRAIVAPDARQLRPARSFADYAITPVKPVRRSLSVAILSREGGSHTTRRLVQEGEARGHRVTVLDTARLYMAINDGPPQIWHEGGALPPFDVLVPRIGASITAYGTAVVRQFETMRAFCVNGADGIAASRDKLHAHQVLARLGVGMPVTAFASSPKDTGNLIRLAGGAPLVVKLLASSQGKGVVLAETEQAAQSVISAFRGVKADFLVQEFVSEARGEDIRCLVIGGKVAASMRRRAARDDFRSNLAQGGLAEPVRITRAERDTAIRAARAFGLGIAGVDLLRAHDGPRVLEVNSSPGFEGIERATGVNLAAVLYAHVERKLGVAPR